MNEAFLERRRTPRVPVQPGTRVDFPLALTVRLVDISTSGVLISSPQQMAVGQRARLQLTLSGEPVDVEVEVRRVIDSVHDSSGRNRYRLGATFVTPNDTARRSVQRFLKEGVS